MTLTVTLNQIREHRPCAERWAKVLRHLGKTEADDTAVSFREILDVMGVADALWCLRALPKEYAGPIRLLACDFAASVLHLVPEGEDRPRQAIEVARRYAQGDATDAELMAAHAAAWAARAAAGDAWAAAEAAAWATYAAAEAAHAAAWVAAWAAAWAARAAAGDAPAWASAADDAAWVDPRDIERAKQKQMFLTWLEQFEVAA